MKTGIGFRPSVPENLSHNSPAPDSVAVYLRFFVVVVLLLLLQNKTKKQKHKVFFLFVLKK